LWRRCESAIRFMAAGDRRLPGSTQSVEKPVETAGGERGKVLALSTLEQFALRDSSVTRARDLRHWHSVTGGL
jgi:hypothetical protein